MKERMHSVRLMACAVALVMALVALTACSGATSGSSASSASSTADASASAASSASSSQSSAKDEASKSTSIAELSSSADGHTGSKVPKKKGTVTTSIDMTGYEAGKVVRVWVPIATDNEYQTIKDVQVKGGDAAARAEVTEDALGNKMAYIEWAADADPAARTATVAFHATRSEAQRPELVEKGDVPEDVAKEYLGSSAMVKVDDPEVVKLAESITAGKSSILDKAQAIYDWVYENMNRDNDVVGCGDGDVCRLITPGVLSGKCTDINSVFVALCRASGVPAREMFGIRMNADDITGNQHCWCEFYLPGTGWVPADPADVLKAVLTDQLDKTSEEALEKKDYYWGQWDQNRVEYSHGRDITLEPAQAGPALNDFGYPYAEVDGEPVDFYKPKNFVYSIKFEEGGVKPKTTKGTVTNTIDMSSYEEGKAVRVWLPVPQTLKYQTIDSVKFDAPSAEKAEITTDELGNQMLYIEWGAAAAPADRKATLSFHALRQEILAPEKMPEDGVVPDYVSEYLKSSKMVNAEDPEVVKLAKNITEGKTTVMDKARAIYDWIYENMNRDNDVVGCGDGDVCRLITPDVLSGKCTDINSVFVALCRASDIPAREVFGIRMNADDITGNQHCWASFYVPGTGWYAADPADVLKAVLTDKLDKSSEEAQKKKEYYWGNCDEKRVQLSEGRDITLSPAQAAGPLNMFGYPYAEVDGEAVDYYKPDAFVYTYAFQKDAK